MVPRPSSPPPREENGIFVISVGECDPGGEVLKLHKKVIQGKGYRKTGGLFDHGVSELILVIRNTWS